MIFQPAHADEDTVTFLARHNGMHQRSTTLLGSPSYRRPHHLHDDFRASYGAVGEVCAAEPWVDCAQDDKRGFDGSSSGDGADGVELEQFDDMVVALIREPV